MVESLVVLAEHALSLADAQRLVALHDPDRPSVRVLVPTGGRRNVLVDVLDHLSLLQLREALGAVQGHVERTPAQAEAAVRASVAELQRLGCEASGEVVTQDPVAGAGRRGAGGCGGSRDRHGAARSGGHAAPRLGVRRPGPSRRPGPARVRRLQLGGLTPPAVSQARLRRALLQHAPRRGEEQERREQRQPQQGRGRFE